MTIDPVRIAQNLALGATSSGGPMATQNPTKRYDVATLVALEQALKDVWEVLEAHHPHQDWNVYPGGGGPTRAPSGLSNPNSMLSG